MPGRSWGGFGRKIQLRVEGSGKPVVFALTLGQHDEAAGFVGLMRRRTGKRGVSRATSA